MSFFGDIFGGQDINAAKDNQIQGLMAGLTGATNYLNQNPGIITDYGTQALQPFQQNTSTANTGVNNWQGKLGTSYNNLSSLLGYGPKGAAGELAALQKTPGYQFTKQQGDSAINAANAASGTLASGNQIKALSDYDAGLASQTYQNAVKDAALGVQGAQDALNPYLSLLTPSATGQVGVLGGESAGLVGNNNALAQLFQGTATGVGNAGANANLAQQANNQGLFSGGVNLLSGLLGGSGGLSGLGNSLGSIFGGGSIGGAGSGIGTTAADLFGAGLGAP